MARKKILLILAGDGIGPEVVYQVRRLIEWMDRRRGVGFDVEEGLVGGAAIDATGSSLPDETLEAALSADAILFGSVGGPRWDGLDVSKRPERGLLTLRKELKLFANLRPTVVFDALAGASSLKDELVKGLDLLMVRELTGGIYFGEPRGIETLPDGNRRGVNSEVYTSEEVQRVARVAFELAAKRRRLVHSVDKANVLESGRLWREEVETLHDAEYRDIELHHMYVDNAAMQLIREPKQFDIILTTNMFGDILSDAAAMLTGSLGMLPSASLGEPAASGVRCGLYEPVHGSAPDIAGKDMANPIGELLSFAMLLEHSFDMAEAAEVIKEAVTRVLDGGLRTTDIMQPGMARVSTTVMGDAILRELDKFAA
ncbi:MAG: 3-isopropylmalate dehydrogenase [Alphaproteobacteria bacterium]